MADLKGDQKDGCSSITDKTVNMWDDDFVQSLETPCAEAEYYERVEGLVNEVKMLLKEMKSGEGDVMERLEMVDALHCLGIHGFFKSDIKEILDYVFRLWDGNLALGLGYESSIRNLNATALGFRLLRLHRYRVSPNVLEKFKDKNGQFSFSLGNKGNNQNKNEEEEVMRSMLNLLRCSSVAFPGEKVLEDAKLYSSACLKKILENPGDAYMESFLKEVEYAILYEWYQTFSRWEARNFIEIYELSLLRLKDKKILDLAKLNFNNLQSLYKMEMKNLSRWWTNSGVSNLIATRQRTIEYLLLGVSIVDEAEFSSSRMAVAKVSAILTILDDLFDDHLSLQQIELINKAILQHWDISVLQNIPNNFKEAIEFCFKTVHELAGDATKKQGRDMMQFITKTWADYVEGNLQQAKWNKSGYVPSYNDYIKVAAVTAATGPISLHSILLAAPILADNVIEKMIHNKSRLYELIWMCGRLVDDIHDFQDDKLHGQSSSAISCYMKDRPELSEEESLCQVTGLLNHSLKELTCEFLGPDNFLFDWEDLYFNISRGIQCFYIFGDGFCYHDTGVKERVFKVLIDPVKI